MVLSSPSENMTLFLIPGPYFSIFRLKGFLYDTPYYFKGLKIFENSHFFQFFSMKNWSFYIESFVDFKRPSITFNTLTLYGILYIIWYRLYLNAFFLIKFTFILGVFNFNKFQNLWILALSVSLLIFSFRLGILFEDILRMRLRS